MEMIIVIVIYCGTIRRWQCKQCGMRFLRYIHVSKHVSAFHITIKPWKCQDIECNHKNEFSLSLLWHEHCQGYHSTKYQCRFCKKRLKDHSGMKEHERVHTGEKPFACHCCNHKTARKNDLKKHIKGVHEQTQAWICPKCNQGFFTCDNQHQCI